MSRTPGARGAAAALRELAAPGVAPGALEGVVVLDVTRVVAGPCCSMILADLGATVIKIERPTEPDIAREFPPMLAAHDAEEGDGPTEGLSAFFTQFNRGKLGLSLDLGTDEGKDLLRALVAQADVLVENFRAGTMDRLGVGYDALRRVNPRLVYTALSGYGQTGPARGRPAYDNSAQATGGLWSMNGLPGQAPVRVGTIIGDLSATLYGVIGTLAALRHAERSGEGQLVDVSQQDSVLSLTENAVVTYTVEGKVPQPLGNDHPFVRPYGLFPCKDGFVFFGGYTDKFWRLACRIFGEPGLADDERVDTMAKRFTDDAYEQVVRPAVDRWFAHRTKAELEQLAGDEIPLSAIKDIGEVVRDPQVQARDMVVDVTHPTYGVLRMVGSPLKLGATPAQPRTLAPAAGEHTAEVLEALCGLGPEAVRRLREKGVVR